jgi:hypothetical protein
MQGQQQVRTCYWMRPAYLSRANPVDWNGPDGALTPLPGPDRKRGAAMQTVPLHGKKARGRVALVDDADYELIARFSWCVLERVKPNRVIWGPYAYAYVGGGRAHPQQILLHRFLMPGACEIDHWDGNGLNCQRSNLRVATRSQNNANAQKRVRADGTPSSSPWKGVSWRSDRSKWRAYIVLDGRQHPLGNFADEMDAALAYDAAARRMFGLFARVNFPEQDLPAPLPDSARGYLHTCEYCAKSFTSPRKACRFCSDICRAQHHYYLTKPVEG